MISAVSHSLASALPRVEVRISALHGDSQEQQWLRAVGFFEGQSMCVLRRAPFGGPLHVRVGSGGEFAVDMKVAAHIEIDPSPQTESA